MGKKFKRVICLDDNKVYGSVKEASEHYFVSATSVVGTCKGRQEHASGYHFAYVDKEVIEPTQHEKIIDYIKAHGSITQREALNLGIYRLASRICELKQAGAKIKTVKVKVENADGSYSNIARYEAYEYVGNEAI